MSYLKFVKILTKYIFKFFKRFMVNINRTSDIFLEITFSCGIKDIEISEKF